MFSGYCTELKTSTKEYREIKPVRAVLSHAGGLTGGKGPRVS